MIVFNGPNASYTYNGRTYWKGVATEARSPEDGDYLLSLKTEGGDDVFSTGTVEQAPAKKGGVTIVKNGSKTVLQDSSKVNAPAPGSKVDANVGMFKTKDAAVKWAQDRFQVALDKTFSTKVLNLATIEIKTRGDAGNTNFKDIPGVLGAKVDTKPFVGPTIPVEQKAAETKSVEV